MKPIGSQAMQALDRWAIHDLGIPVLCLMENAGRAVARALLAEWGSLKQVLFLIGKGNNGGDGLVAVRHLVARGYMPSVFLCGFTLKDPIQEPVKTHLHILRELNVPCFSILTPTDLKKLERSLRKTQVVVDAMLGTGAHGPLRGMIPGVIQTVTAAKQRARFFVLAVDLPTGLDADRGKIGKGKVLSADLTVTFHRPKTGLLLAPAHTGKLMIAPITIPESLHPRRALHSKKRESSLNYLIQEEIGPYLISRRPLTHKGSYGRLLIIAGSKGMLGAALIAAQAAYRSGAGLVTLATIQSASLIADGLARETLVEGFPETSTHTLNEFAFHQMAKELPRFSALAIGPGLSTHPETAAGLCFLLKTIRKNYPKLPCVLDADALTILAKHRTALRQLPPRAILTPHPGEMLRLTGKGSEAMAKHRLSIAEHFAKTYKTVLLLKGHHTVIAAPYETTQINSTGNAGMASGGIGDALTGMIGSFLAQQIPPYHAACLGAYLHGKAGDIAAALGGKLSLTASRLITHIPFALEAVQ